MIQADELRKRMVSGLGFIAPLPDFQIVHEWKYSVLVQCPEKRKWGDVLAYVLKEKGGSWKRAVWMDEVGGKEVRIQNPCPNEFGWAYKVTQVRE